MTAEQPASSDAGSTGVRRFGKYDIQRQLGAGGMGIVYLAVDRELRRTVALKILSKERAENPLLVKRFRAEGQTAAHLQHSGIIHVYESGEIDELLYLALEYVDGVDLLEWLRKRGVLPIRRSIDIIRQVAEALQHAAEKQIVHRDIKPSNIMIKADGTVKLADMGLARFVDDSDDTSITRAGTTVGTVDYMAPEQAQDSKAADIRSDIYSLGCAWYHMITGTPPYPEGSVTNKLQAHANGRLPDPRSLNSNVPEGVVAVIHRMMAKRPGDRYQTPNELLVDLKNPLLSRSGVSPEVFAALAMEAPPANDGDHEFMPPGSTPPLGSTPLSVGTAATRADWDADFDLDSSEHAEADEADTTPRTRRKKATRPEAPPTNRKGRSQAAEREAPNVLDGSPAYESKSSSNKARQQPKGRADSDAAAPRSRTRPTSSSSPSSNTETPIGAGKSRKRRTGAASEAPTGGGSGIAIDFQRLGLRLVVGALLLGAGWFILSQVPHWFSADDGVAANPYATGPTPTDTPDPEETDDLPEAMAQQDETTPDPAHEFPGMDEAGLNNASISEFLPDWLRSGWGQPDASGLQATLIDPYGRASDSFRTPAAALEGLSGKDAILEFVDAGPHQIKSIDFLPPVGKPVRDITLRAAAGKRTTLLVDADDPEQRHWLAVDKGILQLERLDILILSRGLPGERAPFQLLDLKSSDLVARDCSISVIVPPEATGTITGVAVRVAGGSPGKNRVLLENCSLHLRDLGCIGVDSNSCDVLMGNCLLDSSSAAAIRLSAPQPDTNPLADHLRRVAVLGCSVVSDGPLVSASQSEVAPLPLELRVRRSVMAGRSDAAPWIELQNWPVATDARLELPVARDVTLKCEHVRFINRPRLTALMPGKGAPTLVEDTVTWRQFWKQPLPTDDWIARPEITFTAHQKVRADDLATAFPDELKPGIGARIQLGINATEIPEVADDVELRTLTGLTRVRPPADFGQAPPKGKQLRFDLKRANSFADFVNSPECTSGTTITCFGFGLKSLPPVVIKGKTLRIAFEQEQEGATLVIQPTSDANAEAWFRVEQGHLDLINAPLKIPTSRTRKYPQTILQLQDSEGSLQRCQLLGPDEASPQAALVDVQSADGRKFVSISDSYLSSQGLLLRTNNTEVECSNSIFCSAQSAIELAAGSTRGDLLFYHCTFSGEVAFDISRSAISPDRSRNVFLRNSIFLPPPTGANDAAERIGNTVVLNSSGETSPGRMKWWEANCGYAPQVQHWMTADLSNSTNTLGTDRRRNLTPAQTYQEVVGPNGVLLAGPLVKRNELQPESFRLMPGCDAASRSLDGGALGARTPIGPDLTPTAKPGETPGKTPSKPAPPKGPFRPDF